jgi:hypothetical protein
VSEHAPNVILGERFTRELELAVELHSRQARKRTSIPYLGHGVRRRAHRRRLQRHLREPKASLAQAHGAYMERLQRAADDELRVSLADKVHNARAILADYKLGRSQNSSGWLTAARSAVSLACIAAGRVLLR